MSWLEAIGISLIGGAALFQGGLLAIQYIERHEMQQLIVVVPAPARDQTGEEGVWRAKPYPLCRDALTFRRWPPRQEIDGGYNCRAETAGGL